MNAVFLSHAPRARILGVAVCLAALALLPVSPAAAVTVTAALGLFGLTKTSFRRMVPAALAVTVLASLGSVNVGAMSDTADEGARGGLALESAAPDELNVVTSRTNSNPAFVDGGIAIRPVLFDSTSFPDGAEVDEVVLEVDFAKIDDGFPGTCAPILISGPGDPFNNELFYRLTSPAGTTVDIVDPGTYSVSGYGGRVVVGFDDAATSPPGGVPTSGAFLPDEPLATFDGEDPEGVWELAIGDNSSSDPLCHFAYTLRVEASVPTADLRVSKFVEPQGTIQAGDTFTYTIYVDNLGPDIAQNVTITDTLLSSGAVSIQSCAFSVSQGGGSITQFTCTTGSLVSTQFGTDIGTFRTNMLEPLTPDSQGRLRASFRLVANRTIDATNTTRVTSDTFDPNQSNNFATVDITVVEEADLRIWKLVEPHTTVQAGETFTYTIFVDNLGPSIARNVTISDTLLSSGAVSIQSCAFSVSQGGGSITQFTCTTGPLVSTQFGTDIGTMRTNLLEPLSPTSQGRLRASFRLVANQAVDVNNTARVSSATPDPDMSNNFASVPISVTAVADLAISKTAVGEVQVVGQVGQVFNIGAPGPFPSAPFYTTSNTSVTAGRRIRYTLAITNTGPSRAENVVVSDRLPAGVIMVPGSLTVPGGSCQTGTPGDPQDRMRCGLGTLSSGQSRTIQFDVLVDPAVPPGTVLENDAAVWSDVLDIDNSDDQDNTQTIVSTWADMEIIKLSVGDTIVGSDSDGRLIHQQLPGQATAGNRLRYEISVQNQGPSDAQNVQVLDLLPGQTDTGLLHDPVTFLYADGAACRPLTEQQEIGVFGPGGGKFGQVLWCDLGRVPAGARVTFDIYVLVDPAVPDATTLTNGAFVWWGPSSPPAQPAAFLPFPFPQIPPTLPTTDDPFLDDNFVDTDTLVNTQADIEVKKIVQPQKVNAGEQVKYTIWVTNHGPSTAEDVVLTDTLPPGVTYEVSTGDCNEAAGVVTCDLGDLQPGESVHIDIWVKVNADTAQGQVLENEACAASPTPDPYLGNNCATADIFIEGLADLRVLKFVSPHNPVRAGEQFTYTIIVDNLGPSRAENVVITDTLIASGFVDANGCSIAVSTDGGAIDEFVCNFALSTGVFDLGTFGANWLNPRSPTDMGRVIITINATADEAIDLTNITTVTSDTPDPNLENNVATAVHSVTAVSDLEMTKTAVGEVVTAGCPPVVGGSATDVTAGMNIVYTITVMNTGPSRAENVILYDRMPVGVQILSATPSVGSCSTGTPGNPLDKLECGFGTLGDGASATVTVVAETAWNLPDGMVLENDAFVISDSFDDDNSDNYDHVITTVNRQADLSVTKTDNPDPVVAGELLEYTVTVANDGPSIATDVQVVDTLPVGVQFQMIRDPFSAGVTCSLNPIDERTLSCSLPDMPPGDEVVFTIVVLVDPDAPAVLNNQVSVSSDTADPCAANNTSNEDTGVDRDEQLYVIKTDDPDPVIAGTELTYDITFGNTGPSTATNTRLEDTLPLGVIFDRCEELDPNDEVTCSIVSGDGTTTPQVIRLEQILHNNVVVYTDGGTMDPGEEFRFRIVTDVTSGYVLDGRGDTGPGEACESFFLATGYMHYAHNRVDFTSNEDAEFDDECTRVNSLADLELELEIVPPGGAVVLGEGSDLSDAGTSVALPESVSVLGGEAATAPADASSIADGDATEESRSMTSRIRGALGGLMNRLAGRETESTDAVAVTGEGTPATSAAPAAAALPTQVLAECGAISPGEEITWRATITNNGPSDAADVQFTAQLPEGVVHDPAVVTVEVDGDLVDAPPFIEIRDDGLITVTICRLNAGGVVTIDITTIVREDATGEQVLEAMVITVVDDRCPDRPGRPTPDPNLANNSDALGFFATTASLDVVKTVSFNGLCPGLRGRVTAQPGQRVTYCLEITNNGDTYLDQIEVIDVIETRLGTRTIFTDVITSGADPLVPVAPGETVTRTYTIDPLLGEECGIATNRVSVSGVATNAGRTEFQCVLDAVATDSVRVDVPCAGVDFRLQLPALDNEECETWIQVQNVGERETKAILVIWGDAGFCPPQAAGPLKVECSGLLRPGSAWSFAPSLLPSGGKSAIAYSVNAADRVLDARGNLIPFADMVCEELFFGVVGDHYEWLRFDEAYRFQRTYFGREALNFGAHPGEPLAITVNRQCPDPTDPNVTVNAAYTGVSSDEEGARDPLFGGYTYYAPLIVANQGGLDTWLWIQNSGIECTSLEIWFKAQDNCLRPILGDVLSLAPGESIHFDPNTVVGPDWQGSAWVRASQPLGIVVDIMGANHFSSYKAVPGDIDSIDFSLGTQVNYAPLIYNQQQGWDTLIQVQNLSSTTAAKVKVYYLDRSGGIIQTLVDWICPRGSQTFFLPVIGGIPGNWVGSARVESQEWWSPGDPLVDPPRIQSVVLLEKWDDPARTVRREAMAYNAFTERTLLDWQLGRGDGTDGSAVLAVPLLAKDNRGINSELAITNLVPKPGFTDFVIYLYDQNGLVDRICEKLNEKQVEYIDLSQWGAIAPRWLGSAVISATFWEHDVFDGQGRFVRNYVGLGAVAVERIGGNMSAGDLPGDESKAFEAFPVFDFFLNEGFAACPGVPGR